MIVPGVLILVVLETNTVLNGWWTLPLQLPADQHLQKNYLSSITLPEFCKKMVGVFKTNVQKKAFASFKINFDFSDCDKVLRVKIKMQKHEKNYRNNKYYFGWRIASTHGICRRYIRGI